MGFRRVGSPPPLQGLNRLAHKTSMAAIAGLQPGRYCRPSQCRSHHTHTVTEGLHNRVIALPMATQVGSGD
jgi:hypothetical protein